MTTRRRLPGTYAGWLASVLFCIASELTGAGEPRAGEGQTREFKVSVDGKPRGKCTIIVQSREDGAEVMHISAALSFNYVVYEYRYSSVGTEIWKDDRLIELENTADFNGTKYVVRAGSTNKGLRVTVDGKSSQAQPDVWVTSYWRLPERLAESDSGTGDGVIPAAGSRTARKAAVAVPLLDSDKGKKLLGQLRHVGDETVMVAGRKKACSHYKISGDVDVDVWYDAEQRLIRQETVESGHKTVMELARITGK